MCLFKESLFNKPFLLAVKITLHFGLLHWISCFRDAAAVTWLTRQT